jgi:hypothetical protein
MKKFVLSYSLYVFLFLSACVTEEKISRGYPVLVTNAVLEITEKGAQFSATIDATNPEQVTSYGFIWGQDAALSTGTHTLSLDSLKDKNVYVDIHSALVAKVVYYVRAFAITKTKTAYGNIVSFRSLGSEGPVITGLYPNPAIIGDTVTIQGRNFISDAEVMLKYGEIDISESIVSIKEDQIKFILPPDIDINQGMDVISVTVEGNVTRSVNRLILDRDRMTPVITSVFPLAIKGCDTIRIVGKYLKLGALTNSISNNEGTSFTILHNSKDTILCVIGSLPKVDLVMRVSNGVFATSSEKFDIVSLQPEVISISPLAYTIGDVITVTVKNFPACDNNVEAFVNGTSEKLTILQKKVNELKIQLPENCPGSLVIKLGVYDYYHYSINTIALTPQIESAPPEVYSITPTHGSLNDEIVIKGKNLNQSQVGILQVTSTSNTEIRGKLTEGYAPGGVTDINLANACNAYITIPNAFTYDPPVILDVNPKTITSGAQTITITGKNFNSDMLNNKVTIGNAVYENIGATDFTTLALNPSPLLIPDGATEVHTSYSITVENSTGMSATSAFNLMIDHYPSWFRLKDFPNQSFYNGVDFTIVGKGYAGLGNTDQYGYSSFWQYNPADDTWAKKADYPGTQSYPPALLGAAANGMGYAGLDNSAKEEWWAYDPSSETWERKADYPGTYSTDQFMFELNGKIYAGGGSGLEFWEYNPSTDTWRRKTDIPISCDISNATFSFKGKGYLYSSEPGTSVQEYMYNPTTDSWSVRTINTTTQIYGRTMVFTDFVIFLETVDEANGVTIAPHKIVPGTGQLQNGEYAGLPRWSGTSFVFGNEGYFGIGYGGSNEWWKFDPYKF